MRSQTNQPAQVMANAVNVTQVLECSSMTLLCCVSKRHAMVCSLSSKETGERVT